jgi:hypothetical protein
MLRTLGAYATFLGSSNLAKANNNIYIYIYIYNVRWGQIIVSQLDSFDYIDHYIDACLLVCQSSHDII